MYGLAVRTKQLISVFVAVGLATTVACGGAASNGVTVNRTELAPSQVSQHKQLIDAGDEAWAKRGQPGQADAAIAKWEEALKLKADDAPTCAKLARAYHFAAGGWLSLRSSADRAQLHKRGFTVALQGLRAMSPPLEKLLAQGGKLETAIEVTERDGVPLAYWYAANLGGYAYAAGMAEGLKHKSRVEKIIRFVYKTNPAYFFYGADRFMAAFYAAAPAFIGGDMQQAEKHFDVVAKKAPNFLSAQLLKARFFAVRKKDKAMFETLLTGIINAKPCSDTNQANPCIAKGLEPEAAIEQAKARALLARKNSLFQ